MAPPKESFADWLDPRKRAEILREERWPNEEIKCIYLFMSLPVRSFIIGEN